MVALAMVIFTATASILSGLYAAPASFSASGDFVIMSQDAPTIFSSRVDAGLADALLSVGNISSAWPEVIAFSTWNGVSFVLRGTDLEAFLPELVESSPATPSLADVELDRWSALVGSRLLQRLGVEVPSTIPVTGSYASRIELVDVVGQYETGSYLDDEMLVSLEVARHLTGMPEDTASVISVSTDDPAWLSDVISPDAARFALLNVVPGTATVVVDEPFTVSMQVVNWGSEGGDVTVSVAEDGLVLDESTMTVDPGQTVSVSHNLSFPSTGTRSLEASISGDFPVTRTIEVSVVEPYLTISAPQRALAGEPFTAIVRTYDGLPAAGATVEYSAGAETASAITDNSGAVSLTIDSSGECVLSANAEGYTAASRSVEVVDISSYPDDFLPVVRSMTASPSTAVESETITATITVENSGALPGFHLLPLMLDSSVRTTLNISLGPAEKKSVSVSLDDLGVGTHVLQAGSYSVEISVEPWYADEPDLVQLVIRYGGSGVLSSSASVPIYQAAKISEGNVAVALFSIGAISGLLSLLAISAVFAKEVHEGRSRLGILRTIGASNSQIRRLVLPQALGYAFVGSTAGVAIGLGLSVWLAQSGAFLIFGHQLSFEVDSLLLVTVAIGAVVISVASAFVSAELAARETPIASIKKLEPEPLPEQSIEELLGED